MLATVRRVLTAAALTLSLLVVGLVGPPAASAATVPPLLAYPGSNNIPRVMKAGSSYKITVKFVNAGEQSEKVKYRLHAWCHASTKTIDFYTDWETVTVPRSPGKSQPAATVTPTLKVPAKCSPPAAITRTLLMYNAAVFIDWGRASEPTSTYGADPNNRYIYGPYSKTWYKFNLHARAAYPTLWGSYQAHHTLPQKYKDDFARVGLNVHNPKYLRWWCSTAGVSTNHAKHSKRYNDLWASFFKKNKKPSKEKILAFRSSIQGQFKYACPASGS